MTYTFRILSVFWVWISMGVPAGSAPRKLALLVGIDQYRNMPALHGSVNDVRLMKDLLISKFGFREANILTLTNEAATREGILTAFRTQLIEKARPQDTVVFHFSGHGSQMRDRSGDEPDGRDETIVPHDGRDRGIFDISDDEINTLLRQLLARCWNVTFIFDSCNSSTGQKSGTWRKVLADERPPPETSIATEGDGSGMGQLEDAGYVFLSACGTTEVAGETHSEGQAFGAMTFELTKILQQIEPGTTWQQIMPILIHNVHRELRGQTPQLQGQGNRQVFGVETRSGERHLVVSAVDGEEVTLSGGLAHGLTKGSTFEAVRAGSTRQDGIFRARIELAEVSTVSAKAKVLDSGTPEIGDWVLERYHRYTAPLLYLHLAKNIDTSVSEKIQDPLMNLGGIQLVNDPAKANLTLQYRQAPKRFVFSDQSGKTLAAVSAEDGFEALRKALVSWTQWFNVLAIENQGTTVPNIQLSVRKKGAEAAANTPSSTKFKPGEAVVLQVTNQSSQYLYFTILALDQNGKISEVYPAEEGYQPFQPGGKVAVGFDTGLSAQVHSETTIFKAFATLTPINMAYLTQDGIRSTAAPHPLENLMTPGSRGGDLTPATWATLQIHMVVER